MPTHEQVVIHNDYYFVKFDSTSVVKPGDFVVWMRRDHIPGDTGCLGASSFSSGAFSSLSNDFVHDPGSPDHDPDDHPNYLIKDHGGLVRGGHDIDGDGIDDVYTDLQLFSDGDGRHDPDPFRDDDDDTLVGNEEDTSTYYLCLAEYDKPASEGGNDGTPYTLQNPPTLDSQFKEYEYVKVSFHNPCPLHVTCIHPK